MGVCICVCVRGDMGDRVLKSSMYCVWLCACVRMGGVNQGIFRTLHMFPVLCVDMGGRETRGIRRYGETDHKHSILEGNNWGFGLLEFLLRIAN